MVNTDLITEYFNSCGKLLEVSYDNYISYLENIFSFWGKNLNIYDRNKNHSVETFNAFMSGYEKAKIDFGVATKEPSDIYF
jgi:hypothetical protein